MKELDKIFKLYYRIDLNKNLVSEVMVKPYQVASSYPNLKFAGRTKQDDINKALLDDLQRASEMTGLDITIDFAKTDHDKYAKSGNVSRHWTNQAVDIDYIGGKVVAPRNKDVVNRYVDALLSMGYVKNSEGGNSKAVLTFGFPGHDNHIHVSNKLGSPSSVDPNYEPSDELGSDSFSDSTGSLTKDSSSSPNKKMDSGRDMALFNLAGLMGKKLGLTESFGKNVQRGLGTISIPGSSNKEIRTPIDGVINNSRFASGCKNQIIIQSDSEPKFYLQYCGITKTKVKNGQTVSAGQIIGVMDSNDTVEVILLDSTYNRKNLEPNSIKSTKGTKRRDDNEPRKPEEKTYWDAATAGLIGLPGKIFGNVYDKNTGELKTKKWAPIGAKRPVDPWIADFIKKPFKKKEEQDEEVEKIDENIKRIKGLL